MQGFYSAAIVGTMERTVETKVSYGRMQVNAVSVGSGKTCCRLLAHEKIYLKGHSLTRQEFWVIDWIGGS